MVVRTILLGVAGMVAALGAVPAAACDFIPTEIYFAPGSAALTQAHRVELESEVMIRDALGAGSRLRLTAYSDRVGRGSDNLTLSRRRAEAVRDYLISKGAPADAIDILNRGEARPPVPNARRPAGASQPSGQGGGARRFAGGEGKSGAGLQGAIG